MILDVYNAVKADVQTRFPAAGRFTNAFHHEIGGEEVRGRFKDLPAATWVVPPPGSEKMVRTGKQRVGSTRIRQIFRRVTPVEIVLWAPTLEDLTQEQLSSATGTPAEDQRPAGLVHHYLDALDKDVSAAGFDVVSGGIVYKQQNSHGYAYVLVVELYFGIYQPHHVPTQADTATIVKEIA